MFEKLKNLLKDYVAKYDALKADCDKAIEYAQQTFINRALTDARGKAMTTFNEGVQALYAEYVPQVKEILAGMEDKVRAMVSDDVDEKVISQIQLLRTTKVTQSELDSYMNKYFNNYLVIKALKEIGEEQHLQTDKVFILDDFINMLGDAYKDCMQIFSTYQGKNELGFSTYANEVILKGDKFDRYEEQFKSILKIDVA